MVEFPENMSLFFKNSFKGFRAVGITVGGKLDSKILVIGSGQLNSE